MKKKKPIGSRRLKVSGMTVEEAISQLQKCDPKAVIFIPCTMEGETLPIRTIKPCLVNEVKTWHGDIAYDCCFEDDGSMPNTPKACAVYVGPD